MARNAVPLLSALACLAACGRADGLPDRFEASTTHRPYECAERLADPATGTTLILERTDRQFSERTRNDTTLRFVTGAFGIYRVELAGQYGLSAGDSIRIDCSDDSPSEMEPGGA